MSYALHIKPYRFKAIEIQLLVPSQNDLFKAFEEKKEDCPYWGQVWPAALGLCQYLVENPSYIKNKNALELAGGLGLPSLVAAHFAKHVCCSDYMPEAVQIVAKSAQLNQYTIQTETIDWNHIPVNIPADVVLLSDINYEPAVFEELYIALTQLLSKSIQIILSTPQRLMAKPFIEKILPFVKEQSEIEVLNQENRKEWISIYVLG